MKVTMRIFFTINWDIEQNTNTIKHAASQTERDNRLAHYVGLFWGLELLFGYLATSGARSYILFLFGDPDFL